MPELREHWAGVLGVLLGLVLLVGLVVAIALQPARVEDGHELLAEWFELEGVPPGFELAEAATLPDGRRIVRLVDPAVPEAVKESAESAEDAGEDQPQGPTDWTALEVGPEGRPPREVLIVQYPRRQASSQLRRLFLSTNGNSFGGEGRGGANSKESNKGGMYAGRRVALERDELAWGELAARYVHERELVRGGKFRDGLRVNLSRGETALVLFASWPLGLPASPERVEEILAGLNPRAPVR